MTDLEKMAREGYADLCSRWRAAIDKQENPEGHSLRALEDLARRAHAEGRREGLKEALAVVETRWKSKGGVKRRSLLLVEWIDSHSGRGWRPLDEIAEDCKPLYCRSVGWLVSNRNGMTMLAPHISGERNETIHVCGTGDIAIPNKMIQKVTVLRR